MMSAIQTIQTTVTKMWKAVDLLDEKVQSSSSTTSTTQSSTIQCQCQCADVRSEMLQAINSSNVSITNEVTQKSLGLRSELKSLTRQVTDISDWKESMTPVLTEILNKARISVYSNTKIGENLTQVQEVKDLIRQRTSGGPNVGASASPALQSECFV